MTHFEALAGWRFWGVWLSTIGLGVSVGWELRAWWEGRRSRQRANDIIAEARRLGDVP